MKEQKGEEPIGQPLDDYIRDKHTQEECIGFIDGWRAASAKISHLEALVVAADKVIDSASRRNWLDYVDALDEYNTLKANH